LNFLTAIQVLPNQPFPTFSVSNEDSLTLSVGSDCLNVCNGNPEKALKKFGEHQSEIILTHLHQLLSSQEDPDSEVYSCVINLIKANDEVT